MTETPLQVRETPEGVEVRLHVQPRAKRNEIGGTHGGALKLKVAAPPVDDAANRAVVGFFAALMDVPKARVRIVSGQKSRDKKVLVEGVSVAQILSACLPAAG
ncbi:MAG: DUF167 domain-containing protein [Acidobacteriota bacterium]|jgi:uncharacterized protein (TIGR00251 family)|nr:DUF167 domain-containing protein [Acidobacteriota bacterium]